jgi:hypothetical protein
VISPNPVKVDENGGTATATVANARKLGSLKVTKTVVWKGVKPDPAQTFSICIQGPSYPVTPNCKTFDFDGGSETWSNLIPGDYTVTETDPGTSWIVVVTGSPATVPTDGGQAEAGVTNTFDPGYVTVYKTSSGTTPMADITFYLKGGDLPTAGLTAKTGADGNLVAPGFGDLKPGTYTLCEQVPPGWTSSLGNADPITGIACGAPFTLAAGETKALTVDNTKPGETFTIGYWKTHSCMAPGKQADELSKYLPQTIGKLTLTADLEGCKNAVKILSKLNLNGVKKSSDPLFNYAAQLLAAQLNISSGASGACIATTITDANALLVSKNWNGVSYSPALTAAQKAKATSYNTALDHFNNYGC